MVYSYIVVAEKDLETDKTNHTKGNKKTHHFKQAQTHPLKKE